MLCFQNNVEMNLFCILDEFGIVCFVMLWICWACIKKCLFVFCDMKEKFIIFARKNINNRNT